LRDFAVPNLMIILFCLSESLKTVFKSILYFYKVFLRISIPWAMNKSYIICNWRFFSPLFWKFINTYLIILFASRNRILFTNQRSSLVALKIKNMNELQSATFYLCYYPFSYSLPNRDLSFMKSWYIRGAFYEVERENLKGNGLLSRKYG